MNFVIFVKSDAMMAEIKSDFLQSDDCGFRFASSSPEHPGVKRTFAIRFATCS